MLEINKIHCGDCLELIKQIDDNSIDLIVTDPPYKGHFGKPGGGSFGNRKYFLAVEDGVGSNMDFEIKKYLPMLIKKMKKFNAYFWTSQKLIKDYIIFAEENDFHYDILVWIKTNPIPTKNNKYLPDIEYCIFIREKGAYFNNNEKFDLYRKAFFIPVNKSKFGHPTEKPIDVIKPSILISSKEKDLILDPFIGSGTTAEACKQLDRNFIGIEISPEYCKIANKRLEQETLC